MKITPNFIDTQDRWEVLKFINDLKKPSNEISNHHIKEVLESTLGESHIYDLTQTEVSRYVSSFQSSNNSLFRENLSPIFISLWNRISNHLSLDKTHCFLQIVKMDSGGRITPHYDTSYMGYITLKCNISVISDRYEIWLDNTPYSIEQGDLYCFEASLYKHWTDEFKNPRLLLSYGFLVPYSRMSRDTKDPRVRMSQRIFKYFQNGFFTENKFNI